jgi:hypothetical protein
MRIESNRDWHKLYGEHKHTCFFWSDGEDATYPATDDGLEELTFTWNTRALTATVDQEVVELLSRMIGWAEIANSFVDPETTEVEIEGGETFNMADDIAAAKQALLRLRGEG